MRTKYIITIKKFPDMVICNCDECNGKWVKVEVPKGGFIITMFDDKEKAETYIKGESNLQVTEVKL